MKLKTIGLRDAKAELSAVVDEAQRDRIVITRHGRPAALLVGVDGYDMDDLLLSLDEDLWRAIVERRSRGRRGIPHEEVVRRFGAR
ncbi:MAG: type II toxin-antitoxin system Phd/YefM family antitoxin [Deltaproteobacteria bacterium]|nr:type II toxin-antitoxin system Phd/YefM family antitoxin [Deltaproteobacteria bacterium]